MPLSWKGSAAIRARSLSSCAMAARARDSSFERATIAASSQGIASCCSPRARNARAVHSHILCGPSTPGALTSSITPFIGSDGARAGAFSGLEHASSDFWFASTRSGVDSPSCSIVVCASDRRPRAMRASARNRASSVIKEVKSSAMPPPIAAMSAKQSAGSR
eukprot:scaffold108934_cov26-Tisochrysis_lutea.AAC.2